MASVLDLVKHYQHAIEKYPNDEQKVLKCIDKLFNLDVTVAHLQETGVGRTVNALRKEPGNVGKAARSLVYKWKVMVAAEESDQEGDHNNDSSNYNGHGSGKESDDNDKYDNHRSRDDIKTEPTVHKQMNGDISTKRKYHSSEEEEQDTKKYKYSDSNAKYKQSQVIKKEHESNSDDHSRSDTEDSDSESSESSEEEQEMIPSHKIKIEPTEHKSSSKHSSSSHRSDTGKHDSHSKRSQELDKHSKHRSESSLTSSEKSSKEKSSSSNKHKSSSEKENGSEKKHKSSEKDKKHKDEKSSSKYTSTEKHNHSSDKHRSSSQKSESNSDKDKKSSEKHSSKSEKHSSSSKSHKTDKEKHKISSEKDISKDTSSDKHKSSSSSKEKHSSSSKDKLKGSSSKEKSSHDQKSEKQTSDSKSKSKSEKSERSSDKAKHKSSSNKSSSKHKDKDDVPKKKSKVGNGDSDDGIGCESGASFAEALGMISPAKPKKKPAPAKDTSPSDPFLEDLSPASLLAPTAKLAPLPKIEISSLPEISPNYKPRPPPKFLPHFTDEEAMNITMSSKNQRTKVYSGNKMIGKISSLYELCVQVLQEHIDALEYTGGVPYEILKPVVDKATPQQLFMLEHYNPYLMEDTDHLWKHFCEKNFRCKKRQEMETWREMYMRCQEEQECKLKSLTENIKIAQEAKKAPIKQTKMAYVDSVVKPPRNIARKQAQHGTAHMATASPAARVASLAAASNVLKGGVRAPPAAPVSSSTFNKPKKAPLMLKTLQFMRGRKR